MDSLTVLVLVTAGAILGSVYTYALAVRRPEPEPEMYVRRGIEPVLNCGSCVDCGLVGVDRFGHCATCGSDSIWYPARIREEVTE